MSLGLASPAQAHTVGGCRGSYVKVLGYNLQPCTYSVDRAITGHVNVAWPAGLTDVRVCVEIVSLWSGSDGRNCDAYINSPGGGQTTVYAPFDLCLNTSEQFYLKASIEESGKFYGDVEGPVVTCHLD